MNEFVNQIKSLNKNVPQYLNNTFVVISRGD